MRKQNSMTPEQLKERGRKAAQARWAKHRARLLKINTWNATRQKPAKATEEKK